ncbi:MAG: nucleoside-diphosphate kinase [Aquificaceae bacterium]
MERTLIIIKPDAFEKCATGKIIDIFLSQGFSLRAMKLLRFTKEQAEKFYIVHEGRSFYKELVDFMISGPIVACILEGENAIKRVRDLIGPTDSQEAKKTAPSSIRALFGTDKGKNAIHASDSKESADYEIPFVFSQLEIV